MMNISLNNKTAMVCGSTQGIGKAVAKELAELGANIVLVAKDRDKLTKVLNELSAAGGQQHRFIKADFSFPDELKLKLNDYCKKNGPVHILVNNTGGPPSGRAIDASPKDYIQALTNHLVCNQILVKAVEEGMRKEGYGRIINILSTSVKEPILGLGVSNTVRWAVAGWAKTLSKELGPCGITVNNILPGFTDTARLKTLLKSKAENLGKSYEEILEDSLKMIPAGRLATPEEIGYAAAFLASPAASYINGINLPVDGGRLGCL